MVAGGRGVPFAGTPAGTARRSDRGAVRGWGEGAVSPLRAFVPERRGFSPARARPTAAVICDPSTPAGFRHGFIPTRGPCINKVPFTATKNQNHSNDASLAPLT